jgi:UDP-2,3-diacylglucosamine hydrolase
MLKLKQKIGLIIGGGRAPKIIIDQLLKDKEDFVVIALSGHTSPSSVNSKMKHEWVNIGQIKKTFDLLKKHNISCVSFIGSVNRPSLSNVKTDIEASLFLPKMGFKKFVGGDDKLLSSLMGLFEQQGFHILPATSIASSMKAEKGTLGKIAPKKHEIKDIEEGASILDLISSADIGQALVIEKGYVLGVEAAEGTQRLIKRCKSLKKEQNKCGVLVKIKKKNQDTRVDLPSIGVKTIDAVKNAGLRGIAIQSEYSIIIDKEKVIKKANENNIFLVGI